tara:strand:- start:1125 stop:1460 length:336 start_codon:yes stop_codon:yes gene_type:complete
MTDIQDAYENLKKLNYQKSNHDGVSVFYDDKTYLKIDSKKKVTLSGGSFYTIMKYPKEFKEENIKLQSPAELHNESNHSVYCILADCLFDDTPQELKLIIKSGVESLDKYD